MISDNGVGRLGLEPGVEVLAMVKVPSIILGREIECEPLSGRNVLRAKSAGFYT